MHFLKDLRLRSISEEQNAQSIDHLILLVTSKTKPSLSSEISYWSRKTERYLRDNWSVGFRSSAQH